MTARCLCTVQAIDIAKGHSALAPRCQVVSVWIRACAILLAAIKLSFFPDLSLTVCQGAVQLRGHQSAVTRNHAANAQVALRTNPAQVKMNKKQRISAEVRKLEEVLNRVARPLNSVSENDQRQS